MLHNETPAREGMRADARELECMCVWQSGTPKCTALPTPPLYKKNNEDET